MESTKFAENYQQHHSSAMCKPSSRYAHGDGKNNNKTTKKAMLDKTNILFRQSIVVRFSGDSGDGMQLAGNIFSNVSAERGDQISTFPDYPAEVRAPQGSLNGVSGFQVHVGLGVHTPGDECDVLVSMNPAALKQNAKFLKPNGVAIVDIDSFKKIDLEKALFTTDDPYTEIGLKAQVVEVPMTSMAKAAQAGLDPAAVSAAGNWSGAWFTFAAYALVVGVLFAILFKNPAKAKA